MPITNHLLETKSKRGNCFIWDAENHHPKNEWKIFQYRDQLLWTEK